MSEHHPEETMAIVASDFDPADLPDELIDASRDVARVVSHVSVLCPRIVD
jgi:hypothetical protein